MADTPSLPMVSVVVAARNEASFIEDAVRIILDNDYPGDRLEVIVVDGMSDDGTADLVRRLGEADPRVRLVENPRRITPVAFNLGIGAARGDIVFIFGAHGKIMRGYLRGIVRVLQEHPEVWFAGGGTHSIGVGYWGRAISAAMCSRVGAGNARFRLGHYTGYVDTVSCAGFRKWVFDRIGLFDEELVRNQDDDLSYRVLRAGGKIYMDSNIHYDYFVRGTAWKLWRQYLHYGFWRTRTIQKHGRPASLRQIAPVLFVLAWIALGASALIWHPAVWALVGFAALYGLGLLAGTVHVARRAGFAEALAAPLIFMVLHFSYGLGTLKGVLWFLVLRRGAHHRPEDHPLSR
jgi:glycosyltransferase involved in cell wall biosynthesis